MRADRGQHRRKDLRWNGLGCAVARNIHNFKISDALVFVIGAVFEIAGDAIDRDWRVIKGPPFKDALI